MGITSIGRLSMLSFSLPFKLLGANKMSGSVAHDLSGSIVHFGGEQYDSNKSVTGDKENEI